MELVFCNINQQNRMRQSWKTSKAKIMKDMQVSMLMLMDLRKSVEKEIKRLEQSQLNIKRILASVNANPMPPAKMTTSRYTVGFNPAVPDGCTVASQALGFGLNDTRQYAQATPPVMKHFCKRCSRGHQEDIQIHLKNYCSQYIVQCQRCCTKIKRKNYENHINKCLFQQCEKCHQKIYYKAYKYHKKNAYSTNIISQISCRRSINTEVRKNVNKSGCQTIKTRSKAISTRQRNNRFKAGQFSQVNPGGVLRI